VIGVDHVSIGTDTKLTQPSTRPSSPPPGDHSGPAGGPGGPPPGPRPGQQGPRVGERTNLAWANQTAGFYYVVVDAMFKTGFTAEEIEKIGGANYLRIFAAAANK
jgi:membrane dipeptidase